MKLDTVNVIEYCDDSVLSIRSFQDDEEGNKEAEELFTKILKEQNRSIEDDIEVALEDGFSEQGNYQIFISHSSE